MANKLSKKNTKVQKIVKKAKPVAPVRAGGQVAAAPVNLPKGEFTEAVGRRKVASARVRLFKAAGDFIVNGKAAGQYFDTIQNAHIQYTKPFELTNTKGEYAVSVIVKGSGKSAQLGAVIHGLSRALVKFNPEYRKTLREAGFLTRDDRMKETRKVGMGSKARRQRQSPRR
jgi:small subunit ribosomal protein S9